MEDYDSQLNLWKRMLKKLGITAKFLSNRLYGNPNTISSGISASKARYGKFPDHLLRLMEFEMLLDEYHTGERYVLVTRGVVKDHRELRGLYLAHPKFPTSLTRHIEFARVFPQLVVVKSHIKTYGYSGVVDIGVVIGGKLMSVIKT